MKKASVIGTPISHSLSPLIFELMVQKENYPFLYGRQEVTPEGLGLFLQRLRSDPEQVGVNVTIPLKELVIPELDEIDPAAKAIGAVNVIRVEGRRLHGFNTDVIGIERTLSSKNKNVQNQNCLLIGAGGSAKAVAYILGKQKAKSVAIFNPRSDRGLILAEKFNLLFPETHFHSVTQVADLSESWSLVVNSTPVGMRSSKVSGDDTFFGFLSGLQFETHALAFDLIYTPANTIFLKQARSLGLDTVGGLEMLIGQAIATWELWLRTVRDEKLLLEYMKPFLRGALRLRDSNASLFLTGFMGVGKSSVGRMLSELTGRSFLDTDYQIEKNTNLTVAEIFKLRGETEFRILEKSAVQDLIKGPPSIVALGGGALVNPESLERVLSQGILIHLTAEEAHLEERIAKQAWKRPLMAGLSQSERLDKIKEMMLVRGPIYRQAHYEVSTDRKSQMLTALDILFSLGEKHEDAA